MYYNNNNNLICIAPVCAKKTSVALDQELALARRFVFTYQVAAVFCVK